MSLDLSHQHLEEAPYRIQPPFPQAGFFDDRTVSQGSLESASGSSTIPLAHSMPHLTRDRCCSILLIFTVYLLLSTCLTIGLRLSYTDDKRAYFSRLLSLGNIGFAGFSDERIMMADPPVWEGLKGGEHCLRYATREYTARLLTNAIGREAMKACKETPTEIHGRLLLTNFCQDLGLGRGVWGFWIVNSDEPACQTTWGNFTDLGCVDNGLNMKSSFRRIEARLDNLQIGADWRIMCATTPADIYGRHFFTPTECFNLGKLGIFGVWNVQDTSCESSD